MQILLNCAHSFVSSQSELLVPGEEKENYSKTYSNNQPLIRITFILHILLRYINYIRKNRQSQLPFFLLTAFNIYHSMFQPAWPSSGNIKYKILGGLIATVGF
jgi:hypothetical protein